MNGADLLVAELQKKGVGFVATLCGHGLDDLDDACDRAGMRLVDVRNEQAAGYIAEAVGRLSRTVGVCAVSSGVAHVNALTGVCNAHFDGAPMLLITGSGPSSTAGLGHFQDLDQVAIAAPLCKYAETIHHPERIPQMLHEAFEAATSGRPGPVHLTVPQDVLCAEIHADAIIRVHDAGLPAPTIAAGNPGEIDRIADLISQAARPLLVAGGGIHYADGSAAVTEFTRTLGVPVVVPIWDRGAIIRPIETFMGVVGAASGGPRLLPDADLVLLAGAVCDYRVGYLQPPAVHPDATIVRIHADAFHLNQGAGAHVRVAADPGSALTQLTEAAKSRKIPPGTAWLEEAARRRDAFRRRCLAARKGNGLHALDIIHAVQAVLTDDTIVIIDGGNIGQWAHQALCDRYPGHWLTCGASGVVGYGIPAAMAARLLYPDRHVILISGDGALTFTVAELEAAARQGLPFVVLLADDEAWGITLTGHEARYGRGITSELGPIDYPGMAEAFGARGVRIERAGQILPALRHGLDAEQPTLIHVPVARSSPADE
ncbi:MAG: thiamine pyrophosphate-binding protein [Gemmatimonadetes bacterium]|nr:thiamine pyrophosphate-binding protein [Gemmatimonadota bacterium]